MPNQHVPDGKTQVQLFGIRSRARTREIQRRSRVNETLEESDQAIEEAQAIADREIHRQSARRVSNAEEVIVALLRNNAAYRRTIDRLTDAWGKDKDKALDQAEALLDQEAAALEQNGQYSADLRNWARQRIAAEEPSALPRPFITRKKPK